MGGSVLKKIFLQLYGMFAAAMLSACQTYVSPMDPARFKGVKCEASKDGYLCFRGGTPLPGFYDREVIPFLQAHEYPGEIVVFDRISYKVAEADWRERAVCMTDVFTRTTDVRVNEAKLLYCKMLQVGIEIPKPKITLQPKSTE